MGGEDAMVTGLVGLSHMPGRCSRLSWAQLPLVSSHFALRGLENKASLSVLSSYQNLGWGLGIHGSPPNLGPALEKESVLCLCQDGGWGGEDEGRPESLHSAPFRIQESCASLCHGCVTAASDTVLGCRCAATNRHKCTHPYALPKGYM